MIIEKYEIGRGKTRRNVYGICNSIADAGKEYNPCLARFDTLELATVVMRYMRGDSLSEADEIRAKEALKKADAPTVESKRTREAD